MIKYIRAFFWNLIIINTSLANDAWIFNWGSWEINWQTIVSKLREWNITTDDIPRLISNATDYLMWIAWTIAIIFIIIWAYKIALWSLEWDKSKWRETILLAIWWFVLAALSWVIMKIIIDNFT